MTTGIVLMSRAPIPGRTKTRLETHLSPEECAALHRAFLRDMGIMLKSLKEENGGIRLYLTYTPPGTEEMFKGLIPADFSFFPQRGEGLGERMFNALEYVSQDNQKQIIIGSDLPTLQPDVLLQALKILEEKEVAIGPSQDGGYYLLGTCRPRKFFFADMVWGSNNVLRMTIRAIKNHNLDYGTVPAGLDIDVFPELQELAGKLRFRKNWQFFPQKTAGKIEELSNNNPLLKEDIYGWRNEEKS